MSIHITERTPTTNHKYKARINMLFKHLSTNAALLLYFIRSTSGCFKTGRSFQDIGKKANITDLLITFCKDHEGQQFSVGQQVRVIH